MFDSTWWTVLSLGMTTWVLGLSVWILFERRSPIATVAWILSLSLLPIVGILIYFVLGPRKFKRKKMRHALAAKATRKGHRKRLTTSELEALDHAASATMAMCESAVGPAARPRYAATKVYTGGLELFADIVTDIDAATHHVHMEYYVWHPDNIGTRIRDALIRARERKVEVRILVDSFGTSKSGKRFWKPLRAVGGHVERFNELTIRRWRPRLANFRTHRKIVVVDGTVGYTGGMNVAEYHSSEFRGDKAWRDTHVRLLGPAVRGLQMVFSEGWHYAAGATLEAKAYFPVGETMEDVDLVQILASGPDENHNAVEKLYLSAIMAASQRVYLSSAYFVPGRLMLNALSTAVLRGADVRVMVPAKSDVKMVAAASRSFYPELLSLGVRLYEYQPAMLHAKTLVVDDLLALAGTANADRRSFELNFEVGVANYEDAACEEFVEIFNKHLESAVEITAESVAEYGFGSRLFQNFARLLSPML